MLLEQFFESLSLDFGFLISKDTKHSQQLFCTFVKIFFDGYHTCTKA